MITQRKRPVIRVGPRLAGLPPNEPAPTQAPTSTPTPILPLTAEDILAERKKKEAERKRNERKVRREQLTAIKQALKIPAADILATKKHEKAVAQFLGAQHRSVEITSFSPKKLEEIAAAIGNSDDLRGDKTDPDTWPENDRREGKPEGTSQDQEDDRSFVVKEGTPLEYGQAMIDLPRSMFIPIRWRDTDPDLFVCRLCRETVSNREKHIETVHGESLDKRFGNVIAWQIRQYAERRRAINKAAKKAA